MVSSETNITGARTSTTTSAMLSANDNATVRPRLTDRQRSNSFRRKASIDVLTGQPYHYDHRRHDHNDPTRGRSPSPPVGKEQVKFITEHVPAKTNAVVVTPVPKQSWPSYLIQHQLVLSSSVVLAIFATHALVLLKESHEGHSIDWIASLSAIIPPPIWKNLPLSWTEASLGGPAIIHGSSSSVNPNAAWSSMAMALQYRRDVVVNEVTGERQILYGKGINDIYMVMVWVMIWTAFREASMSFLLIPMGRYFGVGEQKKSPGQSGAVTKNSAGANGHKVMTLQQRKEEHAREGKLLRFAEQGWLVLYDGCMWSFGIVLTDATMKWYYLIQFAFWIQQLLLAILGIEKRRKDFLEFMIHHIITCLLIGFSYSFNLTSVGHAVLCAMDFSDIVLAVCKMLKYMHKDQLADVGFLFFVITWVLSRHYYYGIICWSSFVEVPKYAEMGWDPSRGLFFTPRILRGFQFLLVSLYVVLLFWLAMIIRIVLKVLKGENSDDVRSEDEDEGIVEDEDQEMEEVDMVKKTLKADLHLVDEKIRASIGVTPVPAS
ncbi:sphingosine N-acyltransferase lag1 [Dissophora globulifera]|uniref:Sphingosine N-acyltransferase lag1 n=1 Tax=Dissophora globulifera TaxID=979702 RepID=A0A9P6RNW1_9FUNG|nr:sphingosine N-acyltransferase lag1 [Dissophora globulifera]